jgi:hypothetical protein
MAAFAATAAAKIGSRIVVRGIKEMWPPLPQPPPSKSDQESQVRGSGMWASLPQRPPTKWIRESPLGVLQTNAKEGLSLEPPV